MIKVIVIGDIHGRDSWMSINFNNYDIAVFLGDYVDSFTHSNVEIISNLNEIINLKKKYGDKIILLLGNHDNQYMHLTDKSYICSGFRSEAAYDLYDLFRSNIDLFQNAYQIGNTIFTHAGIHKGWFKFSFKGDIDQKYESIADQLNNPKNKEQLNSLNDVGFIRWGNDEVGGIFWCDKRELSKPIDGFNQVVGHTSVDSLTQIHHDETSIWFCDCLNKKDEFLVLNLKK